MSVDRRSFLKTSVAGAAGLSLAGPAVDSVLASTSEGWTSKKAINPNISNMRVVSCKDAKMCSSTTAFDFKSVNAAVNSAQVSTNMDLMAMQLTQKPTAAEAWKTIFRSSKDWKDTKVMIKVNAVESKQLARVAVIKKITDVLTGYGVPAKNIVLFDGQGGGWATYKDWVSLTDQTKIPGIMSKNYDDLGGKAAYTITGISGGNAPKDLASGVTDIIVNIAVNKGHDSNFNVGKTTLCLKNHFGTFLKDDGMAMHLHSAAGLINSNKTAALVGGNPVRQQLCIIDSLWGTKGGPSGSPTHKLDYLVMGTFAGAVDYCFVKKVREPLQKATHDTNIPKFLTEFGYAETDPEWVEVTSTGVTTEKVNHLESHQALSFTLQSPSLHQSTIHFSVPKDISGQVQCRIFDLRGHLVKELSNHPSINGILWDGKATNGNLISTGNYVIDLRADGFHTAQTMTVVR
jgi:hypothetical protein